ncbi:hypothetical protein [Streptomyces sp. bgisy027]|uniref:hypothetical protein n=1 Tax=Streptomyces sp. bgisy027 TaxID=3413770 RepID=UPI003D74CC16
MTTGSVPWPPRTANASNGAPGRTPGRTRPGRSGSRAYNLRLLGLALKGKAP